MVFKCPIQGSGFRFPTAKPGHIGARGLLTHEIFDRLEGFQFSSTKEPSAFLASTTMGY